MNIFVLRNRAALSIVITAIILIRNLINIDAATINRTGDLDDIIGPKKIVIQKCRLQCFLQTINNWKFSKNLESNESIESCKANSNCYMCYDYCRVLALAEPDLSEAMCSDEVYCMKGCQIACTFHRLKLLSSTTYEVINNS